MGLVGVINSVRHMHFYVTLYVHDDVQCGYRADGCADNNGDGNVSDRGKPAGLSSEHRPTDARPASYAHPDRSQFLLPRCDIHTDVYAVLCAMLFILYPFSALTP